MKKLFTTTDDKHIIEFTSSELVNLLQAHLAIAALCDQFEFTVSPALAPDMPPPQIPPAAPVATTLRCGASTRKVKARTVAGGTRDLSECDETRMCLQCGKEFEVKRKDQKCCSKPCRKAFNNSKRKPRSKQTTTSKKACEDCGKPFAAWRHDQRFCSKCSKRPHAAKKSGSANTTVPPAPAPQRTSATAPKIDRLAAIRAADAKARMKAAGITVPANTFGSDSGIGAPTDEDIEAIRRGKEE